MGNTTPHRTYSSKNDGYYYAVTFEQEPFDKGASRYAFLGKLESDGPDNGKKIVTKVFIQGTRKRYDKWTPDLTASKKAHAFAEKFNVVARDCSIIAQKISFRIPILLKVSENAAFNLFFIFPILKDTKYAVPNDWVAVESYIEGKYVKFNNNYGYEEPELSQLLLAFCHWTWEISGYNFMICDLQGVKSNDGYHLTDPVVHSAEQIYGNTDLGVHGMEEVIKGHRCNWCCRQLKLKPNPVPYYRSNRRVGSKMYRFTLTAEQQLMNRRKKSKYFKVQPKFPSFLFLSVCFLLVCLFVYLFLSSY